MSPREGCTEFGGLQDGGNGCEATCKNACEWWVEFEAGGQALLTESARCCSACPRQLCATRCVRVAGSGRVELSSCCMATNGHAEGKTKTFFSFTSTSWWVFGERLMLSHVHVRIFLLRLVLCFCFLFVSRPSTRTHILFFIGLSTAFADMPACVLVCVCVLHVLCSVSVVDHQQGEYVSAWRYVVTRV